MCNVLPGLRPPDLLRRTGLPASPARARLPVLTVIPVNPPARGVRWKATAATRTYFAPPEPAILTSSLEERGADPSSVLNTMLPDSNKPSKMPSVAGGGRGLGFPSTVSVTAMRRVSE